MSLNVIFSIDDQKKMQEYAFKLVDDDLVQIINDEEQTSLDEDETVDEDSRADAFIEKAHEVISDDDEVGNVAAFDLLCLVVDSINWTQHPKFNTGPYMTSQADDENADE